MYSLWTKFGVINRVARLTFCLQEKNTRNEKSEKCDIGIKSPLRAILLLSLYWGAIGEGAWNQGCSHPALMVQL